MPVSKNRKRAFLIYAIYIVVLGLGQVLWPDNLVLLGAKPDLGLVLAVLCGYLFGWEDGLWVGLASGFIRDILVGQSLGLGMLLLMYAALLSASAFRHQFNRSLPMGLVQIAITTVAYGVVLAGITYFLPVLPDVSRSAADLLWRLMSDLPGFLSVNLIAGAVLIFLLRYLGPYKRGVRMDDPDQTVLGGSVWQVE